MLQSTKELRAISLMLTSLRIQNFKAWGDTDQIRLAPLTVIFGANSAGKSSLGHLLLALKQTVLSADRKRALHMGDENSLVELGTFVELLHNHDLTKPLSFELGWELPGRMEIRDPISQMKFEGDELGLRVDLISDRREQPVVQSLTYDLKNKKTLSLSVGYRRSEEGKFELDSEGIKLVRTAGRVWPLDQPDKFYRISDQSRARFQNSDFLSDLALQTEAILASIQHLGPLRDHPKRIYSWSGETPESVGQRGEFTIAAILAATEQNRMLSRGYKKKQYSFDTFIAQWLKELGVIESFKVKPVAKGRKEYEVLIKTHAGGSEVKVTDVGFGVSQVLPALTQAFYCPANSTVWMEQPEIHLHPQVQATLADAFIAAIQAREDGKERHVQLIVESHSEHLLNRIQRRVAEGALSPEDVAVYFSRRVGSVADLEPLALNEFGEINNWPENFFGDEMSDIAARTLAAMQKKREQARESQS